MIFVNLYYLLTVLLVLYGAEAHRGRSARPSTPPLSLAEVQRSVDSGNEALASLEGVRKSLRRTLDDFRAS